VAAVIDAKGMLTSTLGAKQNNMKIHILETHSMLTISLLVQENSRIDRS
jgi:hypothetical protein